MAPVPLSPGYHSVNPYIVVAGAARLIDFLFEVFAGLEQGRALRDDGAIEHADVLICDSLVMISEASAEYPARPCVHVVWVCCVRRDGASVGSGEAQVTYPVRAR